MDLELSPGGPAGVKAASLSWGISHARRRTKRTLLYNFVRIVRPSPHEPPPPPFVDGNFGIPHPFGMAALRLQTLLRQTLLLAGLLALMPVAGTALCLGDRGHVSIELIGTDCAEEGNDAACMSDCRECEDIPLSVGVAKGTAFRYEAPLASIIMGPLPALDLERAVAVRPPQLETELAPRSILLTPLRC